MVLPVAAGLSATQKLVLNVIMTVASIAYQQSMINKMKKEQEKRKGQKIPVQGQTAPLPIVYGKQLIGGIKTKHLVRDTYTSSTINADSTFDTEFDNTNQGGSKKEFLVVQSALCHEGIEGVKHILVDEIDYQGYTKEQKENSAKFKHRFHIHNNGGTADSGASANGIKTTNLFTDTAYVTAFYKLNRDNPQYQGSPNAQFLVKGRKIRKITRSGSSPNYSYSLNTNYEYSNNPAYCLLDYLTNSKFGRGLSASYIDLESFYKSAQVCDTVVFQNASVSGRINDTKPIFSYSSQSSFPTIADLQPYQAEYLYYAEDTSELFEVTGSSGNYSYNLITAPKREDIKLYECNITLLTDDVLRDNIEKIMSTMHQADLVWTPEGKYKLIVDYPRNASEVSALVNSNHIFTEEDIIQEQLEINYPSAKDRFTQATVRFDNEFEDFKEDSVTWPPSNDPVYSTYLLEDNNNPLTTSLTPDGITNPYHAKAFAENAVRRSRSIYTINVTLTKKALTVEPGDLIKITSANANLSNETIRVEAIKINADFTVQISGYKFDFTTLAWNVDDDVAYSVKREFDNTIAPVTNLSFDSDYGILGTSSGKLTWTPSVSDSVTEYIIEVKPSSGTNFTTLGSTSDNEFDITGLQSNNYDFSVRAKSLTGRLSERAYVLNVTIQLTTVGKVAVIYADTADETTNTQSYNIGTNEFVAYYPYTGDLPTLPIRENISFASFIGASVAVIYADSADETTNTQSYEIGTNEFVAYYNYTGAEPTLPIRTGIEFTRFIGQDGPDGERGAGWWRYETGDTNSISGLSETALNTYFDTATGLEPVAGDRFILVNSATPPAVEAYIRNNANSAWISQAAFIDGNLLVAGTITADKIATSTITVNKLANNIRTDIGAGTGNSNLTNANVSIDAVNQSTGVLDLANRVTGQGNLATSNSVNISNEVSGIGTAVTNLITANTSADARNAIGAGTGNGNGNGNSNLTNSNVSINSASVNDFTSTVQSTNINGGVINTGVVTGGNLNINTTTFFPNSGQGFALGTSSDAGRFVVGSSNQYMWWNGSALIVQGEIVNITDAHLKAQAGGPFTAVTSSVNSLGSSLDGAGSYIFVMVGGGGGGQAYDKDNDNQGSGGGGAGCAIFSFYWNGSTTLAFSCGTGGTGTNATPTGGNASNFSYGGSIIASANGGLGGNKNGVITSGGNANISNNFSFIASYARSGGNTQSTYGSSGGGGVDFFGVSGAGDTFSSFNTSIVTSGGSPWRATNDASVGVNSETRTIMGQGPGFSSIAVGATIGIMGGQGSTFALPDGNNSGNANAMHGGILCGGGAALTTSNSLVASGNGGIGGGGAGVSSDGSRVPGNGGGGGLFWSKL